MTYLSALRILVLTLGLFSLSLVSADYDWNYMNCHNGVYHGNTTTKNYSCTCLEGWTGYDCSIPDCSSSVNVCPNGYNCSSDPFVSGYKEYACSSALPGAGLVSIQFNFTETKSSSCNLTVYNTDTGAPLVFNCSLTDCVLKKQKTDYMLIKCADSNCKCTSWCSGITLGAVSRINGPATFECTTSPNTNEIDCSVNDGYISLTCIAGGCDSGIPPLPESKALLYGLTIGGACLLLVIIAIVAIYSRYIRGKDRAIYAAEKDKDDSYQITLSFANLSCTVGKGEKLRTIISEASGTCHPGELTAVLGPSGAGKTTFLDMLAGRKNTGKIYGKILVNGKPRDSNFKLISGYTLQDDTLLGTMTVYEHLVFVARLKLPPPMPLREKLERVERVMQELNITHIRNSRIGTPMVRGISGGERRRVSIASELVTEPSLLFLDEPTSGLDSNAALSLIQTLQNLAKKKNRTIIFTIHQPSSHIYDLFDRVMLISKGEVLYYGKADVALEHFESQGFKCPRKCNPADFLLDIASKYSNASTKEDGIQLTKISEKSEENSNPKLFKVKNENGEEISAKQEEGWEKKHIYEPYWFDQFALLSRRTLLNSLRNPFLLRLQYIVTIVTALLVGIIFFDLTYDSKGVQDRFGVLFFILALISFSNMSAIDTFFQERALFVRERSNGLYSTSAYFLSKTLCDVIVMRVIPTILLTAITYFMVGLHPGGYHFFINLSVSVLVSLVSVSMCFAVSSVTPSVAIGNLVVVIILLFNMVFGGFLINKASLPAYVSWIQYIAFLNFGYEIVCLNELQGVTIQFDPANVVDIPVDGAIFLKQFDMKKSRVPVDYVLLAEITVSNLILAYLFLRFFIKERR